MGDFTQCCRSKIAATIRREHVPVLMTPDQHKEDRQILDDYHRNRQEENRTE